MDPMNYTPPVQPAPAPSPAYTTSCLKAAWEDVKATPNYISRLLVLGLIMCVPILNFVVAGYLLNRPHHVRADSELRRGRLPSESASSCACRF